LDYVFLKKIIIVIKISCQSKFFWMFGATQSSNPDIFGLLWTLEANFFLIQCPFPIKNFRNVAYTSVLFVVKISYHSKKLQVIEILRSILVEESSAVDVFFATFFWLSISQLNDIFFHQCICMLFLNHHEV